MFIIFPPLSFYFLVWRKQIITSETECSKAVLDCEVAINDDV